VSIWRPGPDVFSNYDVIDSLLLLLLFCLTCDISNVGGLCERLTSMIEIPNNVILIELRGGGSRFSMPV
jgi:hypothetical protein